MTEPIYDGDPADTSVAKAKDWLRLHAQKGVRCPCCKQFVKIYRRPLGSQMARWLIWLVRTWEQQDRARYGSTPRFSFDRKFEEGSAIGVWVDVKQSPVRGGDYAKLVHWGLIEQKPKDPGDTRKDSGMWRPTFRGIDFVNRRCTVPSHVYLYDNILQKTEKTEINIHEALGRKFDYHELMSAPVNVQVPV